MQSNETASLITENTIQKSLDENEELKKLMESDERIAKIINIAKSLE
jgi:hypothetical protein